MRLAVVYLLIAAVAAQAKDLSNWEPVKQMQQGAAVQVLRKGGEPVKGELASATDAAIAVHTKSGDVSIQRAEVQEVGVKKGNGKWIGAAVGAVGGVVLGAAVGTRLSNEGQGDKNAIVAGGAAIGALAGLGLGAASDGGYKTAYRVR